MRNLLNSQGFIGLASVVLLVFGATDAVAEWEITAQGSRKFESKNRTPEEDFKIEELVEADVFFSAGKRNIETKRVFEIDDPFNSFFLSEDCRIDTSNVSFVGEFEHIDPPPHRIEYVFEFQGTATLSTAYPEGEDDRTLPDTFGHVTVVDVLDPFSEPPPAQRDFLHIEFWNPSFPEAPLFLCNMWVEIAISVTP